MASTTFADALRTAISHHQAGRLQQAEQLYRELHAAHPDQPEVLHLLGTVLAQTGRPANALGLLARAVALKPEAAFQHNYGLALQATGHLAEALAAFEALVKYHPEFPHGWLELGGTLRKLSRNDEALVALREAVRRQPQLAEAHYQLGNALGAADQWNDALAAFREALRLQPGEPRFWNNCGAALAALGRLSEAVAACSEALRLRPDYADALSNRGAALKDLGDLEAAVADLRLATQLRPAHGEAHNNLGAVLTSRGELEDAEASFRNALRIRPEHAEAINNLGVLLKDKGELKRAEECFRHAEQLKPAYAAAGSNLLYTIHFDGRFSARAIRAQHDRWARAHAEPLKKEWRSFDCPPLAGRRIRLGYVSPDFRGHAVGLFLLPLFARHDPEQFELFCYSDVLAPDARTAQLRGHIEGKRGTWRNIAGVTDQKAADLIREDRIDILIDLTMHMARNRMLMFARKPAPIQATWLAYCSTTGLEAMDVRLSDPHFEPEEADLTPGTGWYVERTVRLPASWWCYDPAIATPPVNEPPALLGSGVTFGCLNNFTKVSRRALRSWGRLLRELPQSRLVLNAPEGNHRRKAIALLEAKGIAPDRISFVGYLPTDAYFARYHAIDIALDPFPYGGGTTTCDALWMGVPVVTLAGRTAVGRGGVSILRNIGLPELIASSRDQYISLATALARDFDRLRDLRRTLRERMRQSILMDAHSFTQGFEDRLRSLDSF